MYHHTPHDRFSYRRGSPPWKTEEFIEDLDHLVRLMNMTNPLDDEATPVGKDGHSRAALGIAGDLIGSLIQWAINHQAGHIITNFENQSTPEDKPNGDTSDPTKSPDEHHFEKVGASYKYGNPVINRRILAVLLDHLFLYHDWPLPTLARDALWALDYGEARPILQPTSHGKHGLAYSLWQLRMCAIEHVALRRGLGSKKHEAVEIVSKAFGCGKHTVISWEKRLAKDLGHERVKYHLDQAKKRGESASNWEKNPGTGDKSKKYYKKLVEDKADQTLTRDGKAYIKAQKADVS